MEQINPANVQLVYKKVVGMNNLYVYTIWEAIMEIVVSAFKISTSNLTALNDQNPNVVFIINNCLNSVLDSL